MIKRSNKYFEIQDYTGKNITSSTTKSGAISKTKLMDWAFKEGFNKGYAECEEFDYYED
ncbi:hypothetical protein ACRTAL_002364 [Clostridium perfringens]